MKNSLSHVFFASLSLMWSVPAWSDVSGPGHTAIDADNDDPLSAGEMIAEEESGRPTLSGIQCTEGVFKERPESFAAFAQFAKLKCGPMQDAEKRKCIIKTSKLAGIAKKESSGDPFNVTTMDGKEQNKCSVGETGCVGDFLYVLKAMGDNKTLNHQTNFGVLQMSPDRFAVHPRDSIKAIERSLCDQPGKITFEDNLKGAAYFRSARDRLSQLRTCLKDLPPVDFLKRCGLSSKAEKLSAAQNLKAYANTPMIGSALKLASSASDQYADSLKSALLNKWDAMQVGFSSWATSIYKNPNAPGNRRVNEVLGMMLSVCPTINIGLGFNELESVGWEPDATNPQGKSTRGKKVEGRVIPYFDRETQKQKGVCMKELTQAAT
jgi:hypothetical protein